MSKIGTYDLEIATPIPERDGQPDWDYARRGKCGLSVLVIWDSETGRPHFYDEHNLAAGLTHLNSCDLIVSWNGLQFDTPVIEALTKGKVTAPQYDILDHCWRALGSKKKGYRLGEVATRTIGMGKTGQGDSAPKLVAEGRWAELYDYCLNDVYLTRELVNHVIDVGGVIDTEGNLLRLEVPVAGDEDYA